MVKETVMATAEPMIMPINTAIGRMPFLRFFPARRLNPGATAIWSAKMSDLMAV
jgi:hypothetical protein